ITLHQYDWRNSAPDMQKQRLKDFLTADRTQGFSLSEAPLMRFSLCQVADDQYQFIWSHHHLLLDGWSLSLLLQELASYYDALSLGHAIKIRPIRPYREYIAWLQHKDMAQAEAFWRGVLQGFTDPISLGIEHHKEDSTTTSQFSEQKQVLTQEVVQKLHHFAVQNQLTLNIIIQGAWALLLHHYSGCEDLVFGTTVSGRSEEVPEIETMVGLFINTLPVRVKVTGDISLISWIKDMQDDSV